MFPMNHARNYAALFSAIFIWSSAFLVIKFSLSGLGPITLSGIRLFIAFVVLLPLARKKGFQLKNLFTKNSFRYGFFGYTVNLALLSIGLLTCSANISAIIHGLFPVFMILLGYWMLKERITRNRLLGIFFSVAGVVIASIGDLSHNTGNTIAGILLVALSVMTWAYYSVYSKKTAVDMNAFVLTEICVGTGFLCMLPLMIMEQMVTGFSMPGLGALIGLFYLGLMPGAVGIILWNFALKKIDSAVAGIYFNLMPVIGLLLAFFAHEPITSLQVFGCILVLCGVIICSRPEKIIYRKYS